MRSSGLSALVVVVGGFRKERKVDEMTQNYGIPQELNEEMARVVSLCPEAAAVFEKLVALIALHPLEVDSKATDRQGRVDSGTTGPPLSEVPGLGFIQPVRKKLTLNIHEGMFSVGGLPPGSSPCTLPFGAVTDVFCLPTPNKSRPHYTVILLTSAQNPGETSYACPPDTFVFGFDDKLPTERDVVLNKILGIPAFKTARILQPSPAIMRSAKSQKGKPPVLFIEAYLGSKEGVLYFLDSGIVFGFKKPILYFPNEEITALSVRCITARTFSLVLDLKKREDDPLEVEFSMIDHSEFAAIDAYMTSATINLPSIQEASRAHLAKGAGSQQQKEFDTEGGNNIMELAAGSEDEEDDEDFMLNTEKDSGSESSDSSEDSDDDGDDSEAGSGSDAELSMASHGDLSDGLEEEEEDDQETDAEPHPRAKRPTTGKKAVKNATKKKTKNGPTTVELDSSEDDKEVKPQLKGMAATAVAIAQQMKERSKKGGRAGLKKQAAPTSKKRKVVAESLSSEDEDVTLEESSAPNEEPLIIIDDELDELDD